MPKGALASPAAARKAFMAQMKEVMRFAEKRFGETTRTWRHAVKFDITLRPETTQIVGGCFTQDEVYFYLDGGTRVRYATMTPDFQAKTRPWWIGSGPGRGGVRYINRRRPRPGIKARHFADAVADSLDIIMWSYFEVLMDRIATQSGQAL